MSLSIDGLMLNVSYKQPSCQSNMVRQFPDPVNVSPLIKLVRWCMLLTGVGYGVYRHRALQRHENALREARLSRTSGAGLDRPSPGPKETSAENERVGLISVSSGPGPKETSKKSAKTETAASVSTRTSPGPIETTSTAKNDGSGLILAWPSPVPNTTSAENETTASVFMRTSSGPKDTSAENERVGLISVLSSPAPEKTSTENKFSTSIFTRTSQGPEETSPTKNEKTGCISVLTRVELKDTLTNPAENETTVARSSLVPKDNSSNPVENETVASTSARSGLSEYLCSVLGTNRTFWAKSAI